MPMTPLAGLDRTSPTFKTDLDTFFLTNLPQFVTEANALEAAVEADKTAAAGSAVAAAASAVAADASADAAALSEANALSSANAAAMVASPFVSSQTVAVGDVRYSPVDMLTYRAKTAGAHTADPSADATNWARISGNLVGADLKTVGGVSLVGSGDVEVGYLNVPQNNQATTYTLVLSDSGKHIHKSGTSAYTVTIPANASVAFPIGTAVTFVNSGSSGAMTIAITSDTLRIAGAGTTGSKTLAAYGAATAIKVTSTLWMISGSGLT